VYGTTPGRYGASSQIASGSAEQRLTADDLRVLDALKLVAPLMVAGNDWTQNHARGRSCWTNLQTWRADRSSLSGLNFLERRSVESLATVIIPLDDRVILVRLLHGAKFSRRPSEVAQALDAVSGNEFLSGSHGLGERWLLSTL